MTAPPTKLEVIHAYRRLYRGLLHAVSYAKPARFVVRDHLRAAFREPATTKSPGPAAADGSGATTATRAQAQAPVPAQWNAEQIKRTIWFCEAAAKERGLEHRILKNLIKVKINQYRDIKRWKKVFLENSAKYAPSPIALSLLFTRISRDG